MSTCAFCTLPEIKAREIIGDDLAWTFPTNIPITSGHTLIAPRRCVARYEDLSPEEKVSIEGLRMRIMAAQRKLYGAEGFNFAWNDGSAGGQTVPHFHLHVLPRSRGDVEKLDYEPRSFLYRHTPDRVPRPESELSEVAAQIRAMCL